MNLTEEAAKFRPEDVPYRMPLDMYFEENAERWMNEARQQLPELAEKERMSFEEMCPNGDPNNFIPLKAAEQQNAHTEIIKLARSIADQSFLSNPSERQKYEAMSNENRKAQWQFYRSMGMLRENDETLAALRECEREEISKPAKEVKQEDEPKVDDE
jgi:hypothetical protein